MTSSTVIGLLKRRLIDLLGGDAGSPTPVAEPLPPAPAAPLPPEGLSTPRDIPRFHGYPYLWTCLSPGVLDLMVLPGDLADEALIDVARAVARATHLNGCLALGPDRVIYVDPDGACRIGLEVPITGAVEIGTLKPPFLLDETPELIDRIDWARRFVAAHHARFGRGYGDRDRGGVQPSDEAVTLLTGFNDDGSPKGLARCRRCGEMRGLCLDQGPALKGLVIAVHCRCDNHNQCAHCGRPLHERRLGANYYCERLKLVLHVPGVCARQHVCFESGKVH